MRCTRFALRAFLGLVCTVSYGTGFNIPAFAAAPLEDVGVRVPKIAQLISEQDAVLDATYGPYPYDGYDYDEAYQALYDDEYTAPARAAAPANVDEIEAAVKSVTEVVEEAAVEDVVADEVVADEVVVDEPAVAEAADVDETVKPQASQKSSRTCDYDCYEYDCYEYNCDEFNCDDYDYSYEEYGYDIYDDCYDLNTYDNNDETTEKTANLKSDEGLDEAPVAPQVSATPVELEVESPTNPYGEGYPSAYISAQMAEQQLPVDVTAVDHPCDLPGEDLAADDSTCDYCSAERDDCEASECPFALESGRTAAAADAEIDEWYDDFGCYDEAATREAVGSEVNDGVVVTEENAETEADDQAALATANRNTLRAASLNLVLRATAQILEQCSDTMLQMSRGLVSQAESLEREEVRENDEARLEIPETWDGYIGL